ncbi:hypothetical protein PQX77_015939 [Marasmius sp. AFHP31]|nr:hypothetical protein PQX77_015939 [Marasmius sp. AFHP31]
MADVGIPPTIARITGPLVLGYMLNYGLYGVLAVQTYIYYTAFPRDKVAFQAIVYTVFLVETMQTLMISHDAFRTFAYGFGRLQALDEVHLLWFDVCILDGLVAFSVQTYFAYRIHLLSKSKIIAALVLAMALAQLAGSLAVGVITRRVGAFSQIRDFTFIPALFWLGGSAACDVTIAIAMTYTLSRYVDVFNQTKDLVRRLIRLTMETGSLTAVVAIVDLILFLVYPKEDFHITPALILAKLYSNSLLVVFNNRVKIKGGRGMESETSKVNMSFGDAPGTSRSRAPTNGVAYTVEESIWTDAIPMDNVRGNVAVKPKPQSPPDDTTYVNIRPTAV